MKKQTFNVECNTVQSNKNQSAVNFIIPIVEKTGKTSPEFAAHLAFNSPQAAGNYVPGQKYKITIETV